MRGGLPWFRARHNDRHGRQNRAQRARAKPDQNPHPGRVERRQILVEPVEAIVERIDDMVKVGETVMSPLSVTEHAVRGVLDRLRNRTAQ